MLLSPSPSKAIPKSEFVLTTNFDNSSRFCGVGSDPRPGKLPSIVSLIVKTTHSNRSHTCLAVTD